MRYLTLETKVSEYQYDELSEEYKKLIDFAKENTQTAYAPYSQFQVGAAVMLENGKMIGGSNQENSASPTTLCAERVAMFYANSQFPDIAPKAIAIAAYTKGNFLSDPITPCGSCRQVLLETELRYEKPIEIILYGTDKIILIQNVKQLLPLCFEKSSLKLDT